MRAITRLLLGFALGSGLALPVAAQDAQDAPDAGTVLATVNGTEITLGHVAAMRARLPEQYRQLPDDALMRGVLDQLIRQTVLMQELGEPGLRTAMLADNEVRALHAAEMIEQLAESAVSEDEIEALYAERYADQPPEEEVNAAHILVETREEAEEIVQLLADGADFAELARERSVGPSGPNGGDLGWFGPGMMVPDFEAAVMALETGATSEPVETQFGWHVIRMLDRREAEVPALAEVREELLTELQQERVAAEIERLTEAADVQESAEGVDPSAISDPTLFER